MTDKIDSGAVGRAHHWTSRAEIARLAASFLTRPRTSLGGGGGGGTKLSVWADGGFEEAGRCRRRACISSLMQILITKAPSPWQSFADFSHSLARNSISEIIGSFFSGAISSCLLVGGGWGVGKALRRPGKGLALRRIVSAEFWDVDEWQRIRRIRVKVWPQAVRRHTPAEKVTDRDDRLRRWNFHLNAIQPAPNMHLADLGIRDALTNTARQMRLATGHFDCLNEGFF